MLLGAHVGISGGFHNAIASGEEIGCDVVQIFTRNQMQWKSKPITEEQSRLFREAMEGSSVKMAIAHGSYLMNLASPDSGSRNRSIEAFETEVMRCHSLGIGLYIFHPGSHAGSGESAGMEREVESLKTLISRTEDTGVQLAIENMAGQGDTLCSRFEAIAEILKGVGSSRLSVCLDTCHMFAAGYDIRTASGLKRTLSLFNRTVGQSRLAAFHLNDSKRELGARIDRHENIGKGKIGIECFRALLHTRGIGKLPMVLETPNGESMYAKELKLLRKL